MDVDTYKKWPSLFCPHWNSPPLYQQLRQDGVLVNNTGKPLFPVKTGSFLSFFLSFFKIFLLLVWFKISSRWCYSGHWRKVIKGGGGLNKAHGCICTLVVCMPEQNECKPCALKKSSSLIWASQKENNNKLLWSLEIQSWKCLHSLTNPTLTDSDQTQALVWLNEVCHRKW